MEERRRIRRYPLPLKINKINGQGEPDAYLIDLSPLGASIKNSLPFKPMDLIEFSFVPPGEEQEVRLVGEVVWLDFSRDPQSSYTMGVSLLKPCWEFSRSGPR